MSAQYRSGRFSAPVPSKTAPDSALAILKKTDALTESDVASLFSDVDVLCFADYAGPGFAAADVATKFAELFAKSMHTSAIVARAAIPRIAHLSLETCIANPLTENLSATYVDLSSCGLTPNDAAVLARNVLPWNHGVTAWNFADNPQLGDEGVDTLCRALADRATVQRISFKNTSLSAVGHAVETLKRVPSLFQVDFSENPGFASARTAVSDLNNVLQQNLRLLHPPAASQSWPHDDLTDVAAPAPAAESAPAAQETAGKAKPVPAPVRTRSMSTVKKTEPASPTRARSSSRIASEKPATSAQPAEKKPEAAAAAPAEKKSEAAKPAKTEPAKPEAAAAAKPAEKPKEEPAASPEPKKQPAEAAKPKPAAPVERQPSTTQHSQARTSRAPSPSQQRVRMAPVDDGFEAWKKHQEEYNQYIRSSSPSRKLTAEEEKQRLAVRDVVLHPRFLFGKRVDAIRGRTSPQFARPMRGVDKIATPREIRTLAPWMKKDEAAARGEKLTVGNVTRVAVEGATQPTYIKIVDGGETTYINDDPRDLSYFARKVQAGLVSVRGSPAFSCNVPRDVRWSINPGTKGWIPMKAQAPDPGTYTVESDWERNARKLREQRRSASATSRPMFGASAAARIPTTAVKEAPGPGAYEIP